MRQETSFTRWPASGMSRLVVPILAAVIVLGLSACGSKSVRDSERESVKSSSVESSSVKSSSVKRAARGAGQRRMVPAVQGGGYYKDDGPHAKVPADLDDVPDAEPRIEPLREATLRPYEVMGQRFEPMTTLEPFSEMGQASWYGRRFHGNPTATGEPYDMYAMTAAHPTLPLPSYARVTNLENGRSVVVRVNDRGPFLRGRVIDLSYAAAHRLNFINAGSAEVEVEAITHDDIRLARGEQSGTPQSAGQTAAAARDTEAFEKTVADAAAIALAPSKLQPSGAQGRAAYLQLGAFSTPDHAEGLLSRARTRLRGYSDRLHLVNDGDRYRLQVGPFASVDEARDEAARIASLLDLRPFVVER